ncbi:MAG: ABC transporter substrate-binding protein [Actinomycetota bacterium]|jgi:peptide/nickel transport system substrate-binding protein|nr:ABC transporter substrate-binding protein [Actinomycetota bacterium]
MGEHVRPDSLATTDTDAGIYKARFSRRELLAGGAAAASIPAIRALARTGNALSRVRAAEPQSLSKTPKRGGVLTGGISGGSSSDTLDGQAPVTNADFARINSLFEPLAGMNRSSQVQLVLAESITPNTDATEWVIRLRPGITFHNGKDLTADDIIYSFQREVNPKAPKPGAPGLVPVNVAGMKKLDKLTVRVPCHVPFSTFVETIAQVGYGNIVPVGFNPARPVGTGPFRFGSFTPGVQSVFLKYDSYWRSGLPYVDKLILIDVTDETAQVNGLASGQFDVVNLLSVAAMSTVTSSGGKLLIADGGGWTPFTMRVDMPPFDDVRVRQAMRYIVDRRQMMDLVFGGKGTIGNDLFSIWDPSYDHAIAQRQQDLARARSLLKAAGRSNLKVKLVTSNIAQGTVLAAEVFAQQASAAGVTVEISNVTVTDFYGSDYLKWTFAQDYWYSAYYLPQVSDATLPNAPFNECHFANRRYDLLYSEALRTVDITKRTEIIHEMQLIDYDEGGYIIPYFPPVIDGYRANVNGLLPSKVGVSLDNYNFGVVWLD